MRSRKKLEWEVSIHGGQRDNLEADLIAQVVIMLGRELIADARQTQEGGSNEPDNPEQQHRHQDDEAP